MPPVICYNQKWSHNYLIPNFANTVEHVIWGLLYCRHSWDENNYNDANIADPLKNTMMRIHKNYHPLHNASCIWLTYSLAVYLQAFAFYIIIPHPFYSVSVSQKDESFYKRSKNIKENVFRLPAGQTSFLYVFCCGKSDAAVFGQNK